jgi:hypothetical protein
MRTFILDRKVDVTGTSGTGRVAEVVEFDNGLVVVAWRGSFPSIEVHSSLANVVRIHGHNGSTLLTPTGGSGIMTTS